MTPIVIKNKKKLVQKVGLRPPMKKLCSDLSYAIQHSYDALYKRLRRYSGEKPTILYFNHPTGVKNRKV